MAKLFKGTREILRLAGGVKNVKTLYAGDKVVFDRGGATQNTVRIGEHDYPYVKIGNQYWITENFHEHLGTLDTNYKVYPDMGSEGYVYEFKAMFKPDDISGAHIANYTDEFMSMLPNGWRVPARSDFATLGREAGQLKNLTSISIGGTDIFGFNRKYSAKYEGSWSIDSTDFWTSELNGYFPLRAWGNILNNAYYFATGSANNINNENRSFLALRLCKDA